MRTILALIALALAASPAPAAVHAAVPQPGYDTRITLLAPDAPALDLSKKKKKKNGIQVSIADIGSVKKGKRDIEFVARVSGQKAGKRYTCKLTAIFADGTRNEADKVDLGEDGTCTSSIDIPDDWDVLGDATAEMIVKDKKGKMKGAATRTFRIRSTRA